MCTPCFAIAIKNVLDRIRKHDLGPMQHLEAAPPAVQPEERLLTDAPGPS